MSTTQSTSSRMDLYCIETFTANSLRSQVKAKVRVTLHGANYTTSEVLPLIPCAGTAKTFGKDCVDSFYMVATDIPDLNGITVYCDTSKKSTWLLNYITVKVNGKTYKAVFNKWMGSIEQQTLVCIAERTTPYHGGIMHLGPILKFRGNFEDRFWRISAMIVTQNVPRVDGALSFWKTTVDKGRGCTNASHESPVSYSYTPVLFYQQYDYQMWRFDFDVELNPHFEQACYYKLPQDYRIFSFKIPALSQKPGMLFCSCNDRAHPYSFSVGEHTHKSVGWNYMEQMLNRGDTSYHLLIMGGDQIYADPLFAACESVRTWEQQPSKIKWANSYSFFKPKTVEELNVFYFKIYIYCWNIESTARVTSSVPSVMMYDDHDIFDGWGSLNPKMNDCHMLLSIFQIAKKHFFLFQMQGDTSSVLNEHIIENDSDLESRIKPLPHVASFGYPPNLNDEGPFNVGLTLTGGVSVVLYDLRTERRMFSHNANMIMSENSYRNIEKWLKSKHKLSRTQHLFAVLTVPIHYPDSSFFNKLLDLANHSLIDDVRDHYSAVIHRKEQTRVLQHLCRFALSAYTGSRVTVLSGDVHLGAYSTSVMRPKNSDSSILIEQFISSGICAKPPPKYAQKLMSTPLFNTKDKIKTEDGGVIMQEMKRLPDGKRYFSTQNFLRLTPTSSSYSAIWVGCPALRKDQLDATSLNLPLAPPILLERVIQ